MKELTEAQAMKLTPRQIEARREAVLNTVNGLLLKVYREGGYRLLHWSELDVKPNEYYEFFWSNR